MREHDEHRNRKLPTVLAPSRAAADAISGAISGALARIVIGPLDVLKIRFQVQLEPISQKALPGQQVSKYTSVLQALLLILKEEGVPVCPSIASSYADL